MLGPFGATRGNFDFGRSKNAAFYEKTRIVRCKNAFLRYENCVLELEIAKKCKKMRKNQCFWRFAGNIGGFGNVAKNAEMAFFSRFVYKLVKRPYL